MALIAAVDNSTSSTCMKRCNMHSHSLAYTHCLSHSIDHIMCLLHVQTTWLEPANTSWT
eukprot:m.375754 g.375754  ORF g.375754 m.375754 type:complete len:59 (+) comp78546_c0_seq1:178-354(+)